MFAKSGLIVRSSEGLKLCSFLQGRMSLSVLHKRRAELEIYDFQHNDQRKIKWDDDRTWVSIKNPSEFLPKYKDYQEKKNEPIVYLHESLENPKDIVMAHCRQTYYEKEGRWDRLHLLKALKNWPYQYGILTTAPFVPSSERQGIENVANRKLPIFRVFLIAELGTRILSHLSDSFVNVSALGLSCWTGFYVVADSMIKWNVSSNDFNGCDAQPAGGQQRSLESIFMASLVRPEMTKDQTSRGDGNFSREFEGVYKLFKALHFRSPSIVNLHLHRLPFVTVEAVECILASLPNLLNLGIYQCPLLHFGCTGPLLALIEKYEKQSGYIHLDFFPRFHQGPNVSSRNGSFGVVWADPGINTTAGIVKLLCYSYYPKAWSLGMDLFDEAAAFRLWLEKCPMPSWTVVRVNEALKTYQVRRRIKDVSREWMKDLHDPAYERLADEIAAAMFSDDEEPSLVPEPVLARFCGNRGRSESRLGSWPRVYGWWSKHRNECVTCGSEAHILNMFFPYMKHGLCYGCRLIKALSKQDDHMRSWQKIAALKWLGNSPYTHQHRTLEAALSNSHWPHAAYFASKMDKICEFEKVHFQKAHSPDVLWHIDRASLARRFRREYEPHGPIDRRREDWQYTPIGGAPGMATVDLASRGLIYHLRFFTPRVEEQCMVEVLGGTPQASTWPLDRLGAAVFRKQCSYLETYIQHAPREVIESELERLNREAHQEIRNEQALWDELKARPNLTAQNRDKMRDAFLERNKHTRAYWKKHWVDVQRREQMWQ
ncbi:hypothetical protein VTK73DRAFT_7171 [Phialemonium thermophilum]|uniref:Uncharacterized protein n=1 Tax=Phialemonium thermophilum TaxID=223376 RepID=A0ABR3XUT8_9PEZI